ncbi:MAG: glycerol-3-phosphate 1-O-acyltransferase PlsY [Candidatus Nitronauta litoralis]|uniref:Glycerol-3-phosphate acyltransferase n=1 Tax=Candidatus Nitronauta litoralis TaxID=2705533 RepID=A0A7T0BTZ9_9BACT|nr:MAG: glycerol-3-phosphate 1-O-acyltransferase PlsY [Candidatus Nitronauta litoralis]
MNLLIILCLTAYLLGSIPFGVIFARLNKVDLRKHGSGNIGATNVARTLGKKLGVLTLVGDALKGVAAVALADALQTNPVHIAIAGLLAFLGHLFPVFLKFRGGKGVATGLGIFLYLMPIPTLASMAVFGVSLWMWNFVSLSSIVAAATIPLLAFFFSMEQAYAALASVVAVLVIIRHHANISRLMKGTENRFPSKS